MSNEVSFAGHLLMNCAQSNWKIETDRESKRIKDVMWLGMNGHHEWINLTFKWSSLIYSHHNGIPFRFSYVRCLFANLEAIKE
jgi:hypothetical protein